MEGPEGSQEIPGSPAGAGPIREREEVGSVSVRGSVSWIQHLLRELQELLPPGKRRHAGRGVSFLSSSAPFPVFPEHFLWSEPKVEPDGAAAPAPACKAVWKGGFGAE